MTDEECSTINVLDIDIDLFVDPRPRNARPDERLDDEHFCTWDSAHAGRYIRTITGLPCNERLPGQVFDTHEQLLPALSSLNSPVHLFHLDSHADLGIGMGCYRFHSKFLAIPQASRIGALNEFSPREGDFLLYALACGFVKAIDYVTHPDVFCFEPDIPIGMDVWEIPYSAGHLVLRRFEGTHTEYGERQGQWHEERSIPLRMHNRDAVVGRIASFDQIFITRSPSYTPRACDILVEALQSEFIETSPRQGSQA